MELRTAFSPKGSVQPLTASTPGSRRQPLSV